MNYRLSIKMADSKRFYSTYNDQPNLLNNNNLILDPWFITGFIDAEGSFVCSLRERESSVTGWKIQPLFAIALHKKDITILRSIQSYFGGVGNIRNHGKDSYILDISSQKQLLNILSHFEKYPLVTKKKADFLLFREVVLIMQRKEHLTLEGLNTIVNIRASMNWGLTEKLKEAFPHAIPAERPLIENQVVPHGLWLAGFASGEACFFVSLRKATTKIGYQVLLLFELTQHSRDEVLMKSLLEYLGCGKLIKIKDRDIVRFKVEKFADLIEKIIPFFESYKIVGIKCLDYKDWVKVANLMIDKNHLTVEGLDQIRKIKDGMNKKREEEIN